MDSEGQVADFLEACQVVFILISSLTLQISSSNLVTQKLDCVYPPRSFL